MLAGPGEGRGGEGRGGRDGGRTVCSWLVIFIVCIPVPHFPHPTLKIPRPHPPLSMSQSRGHHNRAQLSMSPLPYPILHVQEPKSSYPRPHSDTQHPKPTQGRRHHRGLIPTPFPLLYPPPNMATPRSCCINRLASYPRLLRYSFFRSGGKKLEHRSLWYEARGQ